MSTKKVNKQFKILYALGSFFVVAGHYHNGGVNLLFDWFKPYAFHLGLFVFCSGYFYKPENEKSIGKYVLGRTKKLLLPLYLWNLFYGLLMLLLNHAGCNFNIEFNWYSLLIAPLSDGHQFLLNMASWFIAPLFMVQVFVVVFRRMLKVIRIENEVVIFAILMLIGIAGVWLAALGNRSGLWLVRTRFCYFLPFYGMGYLYKAILEEKIDKVKSIIYFTLVFGIQSIIMLIYPGGIFYIPSWCEDFDNGIVPFLIGFVGIAFWVRCAKILVPAVGDSKLVRLVADNTFSIMMHHFLGFFFLQGGFALLKYFNIACSSFDLEAYISNPQYGYIPFGNLSFTLFIVFGSMVFSILLGKIPSLLVKRRCST